jgi:hypothetical protein
VSKFEFTVTIVSIVIAFALCELLAGWGRLLRQQPRPRIDPLFAAWSLGILLLAILQWSGLWVYAETPFESTSQLFVLLAPPLLLVPIAFLLSPDPQPGRPLDLEPLASLAWTGRLRGRRLQAARARHRRARDPLARDRRLRARPGRGAGVVRAVSGR